MHSTRVKLVASVGSLAASSLLLLAVPTGPTHAWQRPPMPCVAIRAGIYPVGSGFCPATAVAIDWHKIARQLDAAGSGAAPTNTTHHTASPT